MSNLRNETDISVENDSARVHLPNGGYGSHAENCGR